MVSLESRKKERKRENRRRESGITVGMGEREPTEDRARNRESRRKAAPEKTSSARMEYGSISATEKSSALPVQSNSFNLRRSRPVSCF